MRFLMPTQINKLGKVSFEYADRHLFCLGENKSNIS